MLKFQNKTVLVTGSGTGIGQAITKKFVEKFSDILNEIGVSATPNEIGVGEVEKGDYYSRCFSQTTRMVTNKGSLKISGTNIDAVQIIQKG